jgi:hypothetical protein
LTPYNKFARRVATALTHLQEGCPNNIQRGNLSATSPKKVKFKVKNQINLKILEFRLKIILFPSTPPTAHLNLARQSL